MGCGELRTVFLCFFLVWGSLCFAGDAGSGDHVFDGPDPKIYGHPEADEAVSPFKDVFTKAQAEVNKAWALDSFEKREEALAKALYDYVQEIKKVAVQSKTEPPNLSTLFARLGSLSGPEPRERTFAFLLAAVKLETKDGVRELVDWSTKKYESSLDRHLNAAAKRMLHVAKEDPRNKPWINAFLEMHEGENGSDITDNRALELLTERRELIAIGDLGGLIHRLASDKFSLEIGQREKASEILKAMKPAKEFGPEDIQLSAYLRAMYGDPEMQPPPEVAAKIDEENKKAEQFAKSWNEAREAIFKTDESTGHIQIDWDAKVKAFDREGNEHTYTAEEWLAEQDRDIGADQLTRSGAAWGGERGGSTILAGHATKRGETPQVAIQIPVDGAVEVGETKKIPLRDGDRIDVDPHATYSDLAHAVNSVLPTGTGAWNAVRFNRATEPGKRFVFLDANGNVATTGIPKEGKANGPHGAPDSHPQSAAALHLKSVAPVADADVPKVEKDGLFPISLALNAPHLAGNSSLTFSDLELALNRGGPLIWGPGDTPGTTLVFTGFADGKYLVRTVDGHGNLVAGKSYVLTKDQLKGVIKPDPDAKKSAESEPPPAKPESLGAGLLAVPIQAFPENVKPAQAPAQPAALMSDLTGEELEAKLAKGEAVAWKAESTADGHKVQWLVVGRTPELSGQKVFLIKMVDGKPSGNYSLDLLKPAAP